MFLAYYIHVILHGTCIRYEVKIVLNLWQNLRQYDVVWEKRRRVHLSVVTLPVAEIGEGDSNWQVGERRTLDARARRLGPRAKQDVFK